MANNFKVWAEDNDKLLSQEEFEAVSKDGFKVGDLLSAQKINTILRQNSLMSAALGDVLSLNNNAPVTTSNRLDVASLLLQQITSTKIVLNQKLELLPENWELIDSISSVWAQTILLENIQDFKYKNILLNPEKESIIFQTNPDSSLEDEWINIRNTIITNDGIRFYSMAKPSLKIVLSITLLEPQYKIFPGICLLNDNTNPLFTQDANCAHLGHKERFYIPPHSNNAFGANLSVCVNCGHIDTEYIMPEQVLQLTNCDHPEEHQIFIPVQNNRHVCVCGQCYQIASAQQFLHNPNTLYSNDYHWTECKDCKKILAYPCAHRWSTEKTNRVDDDEFHGRTCEQCDITEEKHNYLRGLDPTEYCQTCSHKCTHSNTYVKQLSNNHHETFCSYCNTSIGGAHNCTFSSQQFIAQKTGHSAVKVCSTCGQFEVTQDMPHNQHYTELDSTYHTITCGIPIGTNEIIRTCYAFKWYTNPLGNSVKALCSAYNTHTVVPADEKKDLCPGSLAIWDAQTGNFLHINHAPVYLTNQQYKDGCGYDFGIAKHFIAKYDENGVGICKCGFEFKPCNHIGENGESLYSRDLDNCENEVACSRCGVTTTFEHEWNDEICGQKTTCKYCKQTKDPSHRQHSQINVPCAEEPVDCEYCNARINKTEHYYTQEADNSAHWYECEYCGATKNKESHNIPVYTKLSNTEHEGKCTGCYRTLTFSHSPSTMMKDGTHHWYQKCSKCDFEGTENNKEDHSFTWRYDYSSNEHYQYCPTCSYMTDKEPCVFDNKITDNVSYTNASVSSYHRVKCSVCNNFMYEDHDILKGEPTYENYDDHTSYFHRANCSICGAELTEGSGRCLEKCIFENDNGSPTADGHNVKCKICGGIPSTTHRYFSDDYCHICGYKN